MEAEEDRIEKVVGFMAQLIACHLCGTRIRYGDYECPHCGQDIEEDLRHWARGLVERLNG